MLQGSPCRALCSIGRPAALLWTAVRPEPSARCGLTALHSRGPTAQHIGTALEVSHRVLRQWSVRGRLPLPNSSRTSALISSVLSHPSPGWFLSISRCLPSIKEKKKSAPSLDPQCFLQLPLPYIAKFLQRNFCPCCFYFFISHSFGVKIHY